MDKTVSWQDLCTQIGELQGDLAIVRADLAIKARTLAEREAECERLRKERDAIKDPLLYRRMIDELWTRVGEQKGVHIVDAVELLAAERDTLRAQLAERDAEIGRLRLDVTAAHGRGHSECIDRLTKIGGFETWPGMVYLREACQERDRLRARLAECARAGCPTASEDFEAAYYNNTDLLLKAKARLSELEPVAEAVRLIAAELENLAGDASEMSAERDDRIRADVRFDIARQLQEILPKKGPKS